MRQVLLNNKLIELGFVNLAENETINYYGELIWDTYDYEIWIEPVVEKRPFETFYTEGMEKLMEIPVMGHYTEIYRIAKFDLYMIHIASGPFENYFNIHVYDKQTLGKIAQSQVSEGFLFFGDQSDLAKKLPELIKLLEPDKIKLY